MARFSQSRLRNDVIKGAIAGAVGTWVMGKVTRRKTSYGVAAEKAAHLAGASLDHDQRERLGLAIHWALGIGAGAAYAVLRRRFHALGRTAGLGFGTAFWALLDEGLVPTLGLTPGPRAFPWQTHARGFAGHLTFGTVTDGTLRLLDVIA
jgi:uncharacterized membrane protein YagU involved in acid resistance